MRFEIKESNGSNVFGEGQMVTEDSAYITMYPAPIGDNKHPSKLELDETTTVEYRLSGTKGTYFVTRIE
jgi:hypothetical protein